MDNAFIARRPWAATLIAFVFGPFIAMLYIGRGRLALVYLSAGILVSAILLYFLPQLIMLGTDAATVWLAALPVTLVGMVHTHWQAQQRSPDEPLPQYSRWFVLTGLVLAFPLAALLIRSFLYRPFDARSGSMGPTIESDDYFLATKFAYGGHPPQRGDVVVFRAAYNGQRYVKRVVGLPGERIQLKDGIVFINDVPVPRRHVGDESVDCLAATPCHVPIYEERFPGGRTARVLDRYRSGGDDTGVFVVPQNAYFVLGDDRDESLDSRSAEIGFVPRDAIRGRVDYKYVAGGHWTWQRVH
ncbi:MAG TPA: signal peptidase I [Rhizomicrobium sp.]|nr:signal peptidase I [Rhizomicrobium sp.]